MATASRSMLYASSTVAGVITIKPGIMRVDSFHALAMEWPAARSAAGGQTDGDRAGHPGPPVQRGRLIDDLVEGDRRKIRELHFDDRPHAFDGRADRQADHGIFANWRVEDPAGKLLRQILGRLERAAKAADILTVNKHTRIFRQGAGLGFTNGVQVSNAHATEFVL